jgi:glycosyltransferase involved in cell wall biosynthesis
LVSERKIAIVSTFANACGGSEGRAVHLYRLLSQRVPVELWTDGEPDAVLAERWPIRRVDPTRGDFPRRSDVVMVGAPRFGRWLRRAEARRVTLIYNSNTPERLERRLRRLGRVPKDELRLVFASKRLADSVPHSGTVQLSPIDLERFHPRERAPGPLCVGRLSRDERYKHGEEDPDLYLRLAAEGVRVRVRGGTCLRDDLRGADGVQLEPASPLQPERFLQELDVFVYRTRTDWFEASARVVVEALACGLVVVAHERGGYVEYLKHGENSFLFRTQEEGLEHVLRLRDDPALLRRMGATARASAETLYSDEALADIIAFYVE